MSELQESLLSDIPKLNEDSQAFVRWILDRVIGIGLRDYGPWDALKDTRDLDKEIADEQADTVVYTAMRAVRRARRSTARVAAFNKAFENEPTGTYLRATDLPPKGPASCVVPGLDAQGVPTSRLQHCADCDVFDGHREDCPYVVVVPGKEQSA